MPNWRRVVCSGSEFINRYFTHMAGRYSLREDVCSLIYPQGSYFVTNNTQVETEDIPFSVHSCRDGFGTQTLASVSVIFSTTSTTGVGPNTRFDFKKLDAGNWAENSSDATVHNLLDVWGFDVTPNTNMIHKYQGIGGTLFGGDLTGPTFGEGDQLHLLIKTSHK